MEAVQLLIIPKARSSRHRNRSSSGSGAISHSEGRICLIIPCCTTNCTTLSNIFLFIFILCNLITLCSNAIVGSRSELYGPNDQVYLLNATTIKHEIFSSKKAWLVEFFSSWCGHCVAYAPKWKQFAQDLVDWQTLVVIAAIDCAEETNIPTCRDFEIMGYPTLKLFPPMAPRMIDDPEEKKEGKEITDEKKKVLNTGKLFDRPESMTKLKLLLMEALVPMFPNDLAPLNISSSMHLSEPKQFWNDPIFKNGASFLLLIYELPLSHVGLEVALRLSAYRDEIKVVRFHKKNQLYKRLQLQKFPSAAYITRDGSIGTIVLEDNQDLVNLLVKTAFGLTKISSTEKSRPRRAEEGSDSNMQNNKEGPQADAPVANEIDPQDHVYLEDLLHAMRNLLRNEIGLIPKIEGTRLHTLKNFIGMLGQYFPFDRKTIKDFLIELSEWILSQREIMGTEYIAKVDQLEEKYKPWADVDVSSAGWIGCKGSISGRRGYPCGLWRLFHSLTVTAFSRREDVQLLGNIYGYVQNFFGCRECAAHFTSMIHRDNALELGSIRQQMRWLWRAHNIVNVRLKGTASEDPAYPKQLYPTIKDCPSCYEEDGESEDFDEDNVEEYLMKVYGKIERSKREVQLIEPARMDGETANNNNQSGNKRAVNSKWLGGLFSVTDVGIFMIIYFSIACLLVLGYLHFRIASKRRRLLDPISIFRYCSSRV